MTPRRAVLAVGGIAALGFGAGSLMRRFGPAGPSPRVRQPAPALAGPRLDDPAARWSAASLAGRAFVVNFWASWCVPCLAEHPLLVAMRREHALPFVGVAWNDRRAAALGWLQRHGNPFDTVLDDPDGAVAAPWAIPGVPATFVVDGGGTMRLRRVGALRPADVGEWFRPLLRELEGSVRRRAEEDAG